MNHVANHVNDHPATDAAVTMNMEKAFLTVTGQLITQGNAAGLDPSSPNCISSATKSSGFDLPNQIADNLLGTGDYRYLIKASKRKKV
jgi:hypothetical protein